MREATPSSMRTTLSVGVARTLAATVSTRSVFRGARVRLVMRVSVDPLRKINLTYPYQLGLRVTLPQPMVSPHANP
jgi:hypothetical protein